ncbi:MAG: hypothetical protein ABFC28_00325 [Rikenellaceae bacterium]
MKKQTKQIIIWTVVAVVAFIVIIIVKNWDAFVSGFSMGGNIGE